MLAFRFPEGGAPRSVQGDCWQCGTCFPWRQSGTSGFEQPFRVCLQEPVEKELATCGCKKYVWGAEITLNSSRGLIRSAKPLAPSQYYHWP
jgi:hypothetical protein